MHLGQQKEYIRYKSAQRLTEAWACLQRARRAGVFDARRHRAEPPAPSPSRREPRGGPRFELLAVRWFFERHHPRHDSTSSAWTSRSPGAPPRRGSGSAFRRGTCATAMTRRRGGPIDHALASHALKMYMANETARGGWAETQRPERPLAAVLVVSRDENLDAVTRDAGRGRNRRLAARGVRARARGHRDDRQLAYVPREKSEPADPARPRTNRSRSPTSRTRNTRRSGARGRTTGISTGTPRWAVQGWRRARDGG